MVPASVSNGIPPDAIEPAFKNRRRASGKA
jgi:hypothetical protein